MKFHNKPTLGPEVDENHEQVQTTDQQLQVNREQEAHAQVEVEQKREPNEEQGREGNEEHVDLPVPEAEAKAEAVNTKTVWPFDRQFENEGALNEFLAEEKCWAIVKKVQLVKGEKTVLRCNKVKRRGKQCAKGLYDAKIKLFKNNHDHDCEESDNRVQQKVSDAVRKFILDQYQLGNKLGGILLLLRDLPDIVQPTKEQVDHIIHYYKPKATNPHVSIAQMEEFVKEHLKVPDDQDAGFVVNFACSPPRTPDSEKFFRIFYSTKRLLGHSLMSKVLHADGTYKIIVQGYPILVVGIIDCERRFHLCGIAITSSESSSDFKFLFESLQEGVIKVANDDVNPDVLVADAAVPISNGFAEAFDRLKKRAHSFTHMMANVQKPPFVGPANKEAFLIDARSLQLSHDQAVFDAGFKVLEAKWAKDEPRFMEYSKKNHILTNGNWFEGYASRTPSTNNALESFNRLLKSQQTFYTRQPLNQFMLHALTIVHQRSQEYIHDKILPTVVIPLPNELLLKAWEYSTSTISMVHKEHERRHTFFVFGRGNTDKITFAEVRKHESKKPKTFAEFVNQQSYIYKMCFNDLANWRDGSCTRAAYFKQYICKHMLAVAYRLNLLDPPDDLLKQVETPAPQKVPRGRPRKTTKVLIVD